MYSNMSFYKGKRVLVTGHTGFKGSWLCMALSMCGADIAGYALEPSRSPAAPAKANSGSVSSVSKDIRSVIGDIRDRDKLFSLFDDFRPEVVFHLAAQPIVREGYKDPVYTYETNVMGTVNVCEAIRLCGSVRSFVNVTTDKVYMPAGKKVCTETDILDGFDPYSNSKSCSELVTSSYKNSFFKNMGIAVSTCRAGNAIGGGDFAKDRMIPDCVRAVTKGGDIIIRNPCSVRPFQHVLEAVSAYMGLAAAQYENINLSDSYNIGPEEQDSVTVGKLADMFCRCWGDGAAWKHIPEADPPRESDSLLIDCSKIKTALDWHPRWDTLQAVQKTVEWYKTYFDGGDPFALMEQQIREFFSLYSPYNLV